MSGRPRQQLPRNISDDWLKGPPCRIGQVLIRSIAERYQICHREDAERSDLARTGDVEDAAELARYDDRGRYRPLKTAPNLRHGWLLVLPDAAAVKHALDLFYPGRLPAFDAWRQGSLMMTPLRETLGRQTGMYRVTAKITDCEIDALVGRFCRSDGGCLRTIFWKRDENGTVASSRLPPEKFDPSHDQTGHDQPALPLLCQEACNLLVAEARRVVKTTQATSETS